MYQSLKTPLNLNQVVILLIQQLGILANKSVFQGRLEIVPRNLKSAMKWFLLLNFLLCLSYYTNVHTHTTLNFSSDAKEIILLANFNKNSEFNIFIDMKISKNILNVNSKVENNVQSRIYIYGKSSYYGCLLSTIIFVKVAKQEDYMFCAQT